jgi:hypothetical protein
MAIETAKGSDAADPIKGYTVAQGAGASNVSGRRVAQCRPGNQVRTLGPVTGFATSAANTNYANIKKGIASRSTGLPMTGLADSQIGFGHRAMDCSTQKAAVKGMGRLARAVSVTAIALETGGKTAGRRRAAVQVRTMTLGAGCGAIGGGIGPVIDVGIGPCSRMDDKWRRRVERVAGVATNHLTTTRQVGPVTADTVGEIRCGKSICRVGFDPVRCVRRVVWRSSGVLITAPQKGQREQH